MRVGRLHELGNRVAHHEPLLRLDVRSRHHDLLELAGLLSAELGRHIAVHTAVAALLDERP